MKLLKRALITVLALTGAALFQSANAAPVPLPMDGDLFMGFHSTTASNEYLVDIGQYSLFNDQPVGFHLSLGNFAADLTTVFGASWATDVNVQWGSVGTLDATSQLFATRAATSSDIAQPWQRQSTASQSFTGSQIDTMAFVGYAGQEATPNNPRGVIHSTAGFSWASYNNGTNSPGSSFSTWVPTVEAPITPNSGSGIVNTRLDLFRIDPDNSGTNPFSQYIGSFSIDANGDVSYDVLAPVPEPSTYASVIGGAALLLVLMRLRRKTANA